MSAFPSLPLFTDAFLADTGHLSAQETGAYLLLIMMAWRSPECRVPDDDAKLARWARVDGRTWRRIKPAIMEFWTLENGFWTQKRLSKERDVVSKRAEVARDNGKHGGRPKSLENNDTANPAGSSRVSQKKAPNPNPSIEGSDTSVSDDAAAPSPAELPIIDQVWLKVPDLTDLSGRKQETVRSWIGKALKDFAPEKVLEGISEAIKAKSGDPFAYARRVMLGSTDPPRRPPRDERPMSVQQAARDFVEEVRRQEKSEARGMKFDEARILTLPAVRYS